MGGTTTKSCSGSKTCSTRPKIGWNNLEQETTTSQDAVPLVKPYGISVLIHNGTIEQELLLDTMNYCDATPSHAQAIILKKLSQSGELTDEKIVDLMEQEKPNQIAKIRIREDKIQSVIPKNLRVDNYEDFVMKACEYYGRHLAKNREQER